MNSERARFSSPIASCNVAVHPRGAGRADASESLALVWLCLLLSALVGGEAAAGIAVTAVDGEVRANGAVVVMHQQLDAPAVGLELETDGGGRCAVMHGDAVLLQLAQDTRIALHRVGEGEGEILELTRGQVVVTSRRGRSDAGLEIRTPSAVLRPFSTSLRLAVDAVTGDTVVTVLEKRVAVTSSDPRFKRSILLNAGQWVTVPSGEAPGEIQLFDVEGPLGEAAATDLRRTALRYDAGRSGDVALDRIAATDVPDSTLAALGIPFSAPAGFVWGREPIVHPDSGCDPTSCGVVPELLGYGPAPPPPCIGIPGEQCQRP